MSKKLLILAGTLVLLANNQLLSVEAAQPVPPPPGVHIIGTDPSSADVSSVLEVVTGLVDASNHHDIEGVLKHYSPKFTSGDSLSLDEVRHLIEETWKTYPDIHYESKIIEVRMNGDWATVESLDAAHATATGDAIINNAPGTLDSQSRGLLFLRKMGKTWEILSDYTVYENANITYGDAKNLKLHLSTPDQVFAGEPYTAKVDVELPQGAFAIAAISKEPLVYPQKKPEDKFRSLTEQQDSLERVFQANHTNNNEMITATIGLTQIGQDEQERPTIKINGIATIVKRVNVLPKSTFAEAQSQELIVKRSANGVIDLSKVPDVKSSDEDSPMSLQKNEGGDKETSPSTPDKNDDTP